MACGLSTCPLTGVAKAAPRAVKTTNEVATERDAGEASAAFLSSNENPRRNERDPRVHANLYMNSESTVQISFH